MTKKTTREIGNDGESLACNFLINKGWEILDRNYIFKKSEIDIIALHQGIYIFVEVKLRSSTTFGTPVEYVTEDKVQHVFKAAEAWMHEQNLLNNPMRFDVIGIIKEKNSPAVFNHIEDAFR